MLSRSLSQPLRRRRRVPYRHCRVAGHRPGRASRRPPCRLALISGCARGQDRGCAHAHRRGGDTDGEQRCRQATTARGMWPTWAVLCVDSARGVAGFASSSQLGTHGSPVRGGKKAGRSATPPHNPAPRPAQKPHGTHTVRGGHQCGRAHVQHPWGRERYGCSWMYRYSFVSSRNGRIGALDSATPAV